MTPGKELTGLLGVILCVVLWSSPNWALAHDVYVVAGGPDYSESVRFAAWSLSERTGIKYEYKGVLPATTDHCKNPDSTVFRTPSFNEWIPDLQFTQEGPIARSLDCIEPGMFVIAMNPHFPLKEEGNLAANLRRTALHELAHSGTPIKGHLADPYAVMYASTVKSTWRNLLTTQDVLWALDEPRWKPAKEPSFCHNELAPNWDLIVPEIIIDGRIMTALLTYGGKEGGYFTWDVAYVTPQPQSQACRNNRKVSDGPAILKDIRGMDGVTYSEATLQPYGGKWRLIGFRQ